MKIFYKKVMKGKPLLFRSTGSELYMVFYHHCRHTGLLGTPGDVLRKLKNAFHQLHKYFSCSLALCNLEYVVKFYQNIL